MTGDLSLMQASSRREVAGLQSPFPMRTQVPAMLQGDPFVCGFLDGLDEVIAPVISVLDCFDAYLDAKMAPLDMVRYMGDWVLASMDDLWTEEKVRRDVTTAAQRARWAGTAKALHDRLVPHEVLGLTITDFGGVEASDRPSDPASWKEPATQTVVLKIKTTDRSQSELERITRIARDVVPAHVVISVVAGS